MHLARMEGKMQGHLRLAKPLPKPGTVINPEPLLGASASQNDLAAHDHMMHVWMSWEVMNILAMQTCDACKGQGQHFQGITVAKPESIQKGSALCKLPVGTTSGTSVMWKRLCPCNGFHLETIE